MLLPPRPTTSYSSPVEAPLITDIFFMLSFPLSYFRHAHLSVLTDRHQEAVQGGKFLVSNFGHVHVKRPVDHVPPGGRDTDVFFPQTF